MKTFREYIMEGVYEDKLSKLKKMREEANALEFKDAKEKALSRADEYERNIKL